MSQVLLKEVLPDLLDRIGVTSKNFALLSVVERELAQVSGNSRIVALKNNKIYVEVESSVHLHEFTFKRGEILKAIQDTFPSDFLHSPPQIKFFLKGMARHPARG